MTIRIKCAGCSKGMRAPDEMAGATVNCPNCSASVLIPTVEEAKQAGIYIAPGEGKSSSGKSKSASKSAAQKQAPQKQAPEKKAPAENVAFASEFSGSDPLAAPDSSGLGSPSGGSQASPLSGQSQTSAIVPPVEEAKEDTTLPVVLTIAVLVTFFIVVFRPTESVGVTPAPAVKIASQPAAAGGLSLNILADGSYTLNNAPVKLTDLLPKLQVSSGGSLNIRVTKEALHGPVMQAIEVAGIAGIGQVTISVE